MSLQRTAGITLHRHELLEALGGHTGMGARELVVVRPFADVVPRRYRHFEVHKDGTCEAGVSIDSPNHVHYTCPYPPGSVVWVKEPWAPVEPGFDKEPADEIAGVRILYKADDQLAVRSLDVWRPASDMVEKMARLWFAVFAVHVMRLNELDSRGAPSSLPGVAARHIRLSVFSRLYGQGFLDGDPLLWVYVLIPTLKPTT